MERPLHGGNDQSAAPTRNGDGRTDAYAGTLAAAHVRRIGIYLDSRGILHPTQRRTMKLRLPSRIVLSFVLVATVLLATVGVLSYRSGSESLKAAAISEMLATAVENEAALNAWIEERLNDIGQIAIDPACVEEVTSLVAAAPGSGQARSV